ncbi:hypothetical protein [Acetobacter thailandicus]|uniref:hypothetical protein n=1 Tax=Acetobacter thailandicus TaxID=1502842 RepID=UPI001FD00D71|nr:hypothetical protein [Acetobacter thailandicus]
MKYVLKGGVAAFVLGALVVLPGCQSAKQAVAAKEDHLAAAGFLDKPATTAAQKAMLARLPAHHFVSRVKGKDVYYVYADPVVCDCLYVGNQAAYDRYQQYAQTKALLNEQATTAQTYEDAQWNWNEWGAWDSPWGPGFVGHGPGW